MKNVQLGKGSLILLAVLLIILQNGCKKEEDLSLKIGVLRVADSMPLYVADKEEIFAEKGIDVELVEFGSYSDQSKAIEAGELDGIMTDMVVQCLLNKSGADLKTIAMALGAIVTEGRFLVVAAPGSSLTEPKDLEGHSVAIAEGTMMEFLLDSYCEELGIDVDKVNKVHVPKLSLRLDMVLEGTHVDAAILPDPLATYAVYGGANVIIDDTKLGSNLSQSVVAINGDLIENHAEEIRLFLEGYNNAIDKINLNPEDYKAYFLEVANVPKELSEEYVVPAFTPDSIPDENSTQKVARWMVKKDLIDRVFTYEELVDISLR